MESNARMMTVAEVAERLGLCERAVWRLRDQGRLPCAYLGPKTVRWESAEVERFIAELPSDAAAFCASE